MMFLCYYYYFFFFIAPFTTIWLKVIRQHILCMSGADLGVWGSRRSWTPFPHPKKREVSIARLAVKRTYRRIKKQPTDNSECISGLLKFFGFWGPLLKKENGSFICKIGVKTNLPLGEKITFWYSEYISSHLKFVDFWGLLKAPWPLSNKKKRGKKDNFPLQNCL